MDQTKRISAFTQLGIHFRNLSGQELDTIAQHARNENSWFSRESVEKALKGIGEFLIPERLISWVAGYPAIKTEKTVALILAGNIPLVGFHDIMCVLISGHRAQIKLSSKDQYLTKYVLQKLVEIEPGFHSRISLTERLSDFDSVIATGSDNSARYFNYYFGKYPHIIRKNRTSVAVVRQNETTEDYHSLGLDVFTYFGLGCRNVSKLYVPAGFSFDALFRAWEPYSDVVNHHKYANNYDYQKSILLINRTPFLDNGFVLLQESDRLVSPISVVFFEYYNSDAELQEKLTSQSEKIQVIVGNHQFCSVRFGEAQCPQLGDYADNTDTMNFLVSIS